MHRLGTGYSKYFDIRHERTGCLFESSYKIKRMKNSVQRRHLSRYIHLNPLDLIGLDWKERRISWKEAGPFLESYAWSSYRHYVGLEELSFIRPEAAMENVGDRSDYVRFLKSWVERDWAEQAKFDAKWFK
jgi:hypothetical protein